LSKSTDIKLKQIESRTERIEYRAPMKFGGRVVTDATLLHVSVVVETEDGRVGTGFGSMPMGNVWAWPSSQVDNADTLAGLVGFGQACAERARRYSLSGHALDITSDLVLDHPLIAEDLQSSLRLAEPIPKLAQLVAASPLEAAIHDAQGKALGHSSYNILGEEFVSRDLSHWLNDDFAGEYLDRYTSRAPKSTMPIYHLVGALDPLTEGDIAERLNDGLPETLGEWIEADGLTHMKIKLNGDDLAWDVDRVVSIDRVATETQRSRGCDKWCYSLDFNEKCANVEYVLEFLAMVKARSPAGFQRAQYIEQPTHRDLKAHPENRMHAAAKIKPVVIDESLVDFESLLLSRELGYSGVALKACKGQTEALMMGAAAQKYGLFLCVQDLTCPGASFLHSASLSCRIPTVAAIEGNGRQYCPAGNRVWDEQFAGMFRITQGTVETGLLSGAGLGY
jgi:L-alanine-DL-glutamate epimerase-like enolase superfamily enzyme